MSGRGINRTRRQPIPAGPLREKALRTLSRKVFHLCEDAEQEQVFECSDKKVAKGTIQTCIGRFRTSPSPESVHSLALDSRLCNHCRAWLALHHATVRLRKITGEA